MGADDELDALRRRLYSPDATDADRAAFRAAEAAAHVEPEPVPVAVDVAPSAPAVPPARTLPARWRLVAIGGATVLVLVGVAAVAVGHPFAPKPVVPTATPSPDVSVIGSIPVPSTASEAFLRALETGKNPELLDYLDTHPALLLGPLRTAGRTDTTGFDGVGPSTLNLAPQRSTTSGHITLVLVTERDVHFQWTPTTVAESNDRSGPERPVANLDGAAEAGQPVSGTVSYSGGVPSRLTLLVPSGVRWGAVIVYTD